MTKIIQENINNFLGSFNIYPENIEIYKTALTHKSANNKPGKNYERLEFLGDVVMKLILTDELLQLYPESSEGLLAQQRAMFIQDRLLAKISKTIGLEKLLICGENERVNKIHQEDSLLADLLESLTGAIYLDKGIEKAKEFILMLFKDALLNQALINELTDNKTKLQEITQSLISGTPIYEIIKEEGPDHKKTFTVKVSITIKKEIYSTISTDKTKKIAEQKAAQLLIEKIKSLK
ncbi:MAG: ribonuclease III [Candidatus Margulisbacteria bacterium]|nr:ribonuclease III [Candidatus Margulisiibacteriota bacterium]